MEYFLNPFNLICLYLFNIIFLYSFNLICLYSFNPSKYSFNLGDWVNPSDQKDKGLGSIAFHVIVRHNKQCVQYKIS